MEGHAYIGELLAGIVYLGVGLQLLRLGQRTRGVPERLLGVMFLLSGASYLVYLMAFIPALESLWTPINFAGRVIYIGPPILLAAFTRQVFRPEGGWAVWLVYGIGVLMIGGVVRGDVCVWGSLTRSSAIVTCCGRCSEWYRFAHP
jgi:hypothetical protein